MKDDRLYLWLKIPVLAALERGQNRAGTIPVRITQQLLRALAERGIVVHLLLAAGTDDADIVSALEAEAQRQAEREAQVEREAQAETAEREAQVEREAQAETAKRAQLLVRMRC